MGFLNMGRHRLSVAPPRMLVKSTVAFHRMLVKSSVAQQAWADENKFVLVKSIVAHQTRHLVGGLNWRHRASVNNFFGLKACCQ